ncbi:hypothetical protein, partial [Pseudomonas amygdali]|uniref:hypothetical protein n=1 Tax=Pseudomonas amygdali TaxID=47877 RepID=UPI001C556BD7
GLLALSGVFGIGEGHLIHHRKARRLVPGDFAKSGSLFQDFPNQARSTEDRHQPPSSDVPNYIKAPEKN